MSNFFQEKLEIEMVIELQDAFRVGNPKSKARLIIVHLQNSKDKWKFFGSTHKLKDLENEEGILYQVFDQLTAKKRVEKQRQRQLLNIDKALDKELQLDMRMDKGILLVDELKYEKKLKVTSCRVMLKAS